MPVPSPQAWLFHAGAPLPTGLGNEAGWGVYDLQTYLAGLSAARRLPRLSPGPVTGVMNTATRAAIQAWLVADGHGTTREFGDMEAARLLRAMTAARVTPIGDRWQPVPWSVSIAVWNAYVTSKGGLAAAFRSRVQANAAATRDAAYAILRAPSPAPSTTRAATPAVATPRIPFAGGGAAVFSSTTTLRRGMCGPLVSGWQAVLNFTRNQHRAPVPTSTHTFDAAHETATKALQRVAGLTGNDVDGIVGPETRSRVRALIERNGYSLTAVPALTAAPCTSSTAATPAGGSSSSGSSAGGGTSVGSGDSLGGAAPASGVFGGALNFFSQYGPVMAVGLGVAAFAMLGGGGGGRRR